MSVVVAAAPVVVKSGKGRLAPSFASSNFGTVFFTPLLLPAGSIISATTAANIFKVGTLIIDEKDEQKKRKEWEKGEKKDKNKVKGNEENKSRQTGKR